MWVAAGALGQHPGAPPVPENKKATRLSGFLVEDIGRGKRIRTSGPCVPNAVLYQAEPHSDLRRGLIPRPDTARKPGSRLFLRKGETAAKKRKGGVASPATLAYLGASREPVSRRTGPAGEWCNGNTPVFGTVIQGSSPCGPTKRTNKVLMSIDVRIFCFYDLCHFSSGKFVQNLANDTI